MLIIWKFNYTNTKFNIQIIQTIALPWIKNRKDSSKDA